MSSKRIAMLTAVIIVLLSISIIQLYSVVAQTGPPVRYAVWRTSQLTSDLTESTTWVDMSGMSLTISIPRSGGSLTITFSCGAKLIVGGQDRAIRIMVRVGPHIAEPGDVVLTQSDLYSLCSFTFYRENIPEGSYDIQVQWKVSQLTTGFVEKRILVVEFATL